jgi:hypothetical protein
MKPLIPAVLVVLLAACSSSGAPSANAAVTAAQSATPTESTTPPPTPTDSPTPKPTEKPAADVTKVQQVVIPWRRDRSDPYTNVLVLIEVENHGDGWAELLPSSSDYSLLSSDGSVAGTGSFLYAYPALVAPGKHGFMWDGTAIDGVSPDDIADAEIDARFDDASDVDAESFSFTKVTWKQPQYEQGLSATGFITNKTNADMLSVAVGVVFYDKAGKILGVSDTNLVENLDAGERQGFETLAENPVSPKKVDHVEVFASDMSF